MGPGGQFLDQDYTLENYRREQWQPQLTNRMEWKEWQRTSGGQDMRQRASQRNQDMLARLNPYLSPVSIDYAGDVLPLTPAGSSTSTLF